MLVIKSVEKNSLSQELGLKKGDKILKFDGYEAIDILDYIYYESQEKFEITVLSGGKEIDFDIEKDEYESIGLDFEDDNLDIITCRNNCIFCFIDQMPKGHRNTLYVKDDDYRQSFLCGNFVTLTNVSERDIERIIRLNLSPLYISVHTTNGELRKKILNNRFADKINYYLQVLSDAGIEIHTQVVLVKGVNDGEELERTMSDLSRLSGVKSLAVVPCGITEHREGLFHIEDIDKEYSLEVVSQVRNFNRKLGSNFVKCADEFYVRAEINTESDDFYDDFEQVGNGVGTLNLFEQEYNLVARKSTYNRTFLIVTGVSAKSFITKFAKKTEGLTKGLKVYVVGAENEFFGKTVTCAGLLCGSDVLNAVQKFKQDFDELVISDIMLRNGESVFLDDYTVEELSKQIGKPVRVAPNGGAGFFETLTKQR